MIKTEKVEILPGQMPENAGIHHTTITLEQDERNLWFYSIELKLKEFWMQVPVSITQFGEESKEDCLSQALVCIEKNIAPSYFNDHDDKAICAALLEEINRLGTNGQRALF